ncbi:MAG: methionine gamma-lyase family protein [Firmicutes bacterium]|nr:methionine gamma-lyase family protein [Bacillota bacterium]
MTKQEIINLINQAEKQNENAFKTIEANAFLNQEKVLDAFKGNCVALRHFAGSTGYSYEDEGKHILSRVFATAFCAESAIVSPLIASGTHAISTALFGLLRPHDTLYSPTGMPYDTLVPVIIGDNNGSLKEFDVTFSKTDFLDNGELDIEKIKIALKEKPTVVFIQRSRGYRWRNSLSIETIGEMVNLVNKITPKSLIVVDNCYGEFAETREPLEVGADIIIGSLIKNPGGGLAPTGGYIAGKKDLIGKIANRLTAPGVGVEVGSYTDGYRNFFQGYFMAPHTTAEALKGALLFRSVFSCLGYEVLPKVCNNKNTLSDIICSIKFNNPDKLVAFCQAIQACSPIDSFAKPMPWDMPGYDNKVIMASGSFVQGSSIELSADGPMREPYIAFMQGGLNYAHIKIALQRVLEEF